MYYYSWTGMTVCVDGWSPKVEKECFAPFKSDKPEGKLINVKVVYVDQLPALEGTIVHSEYEYEVVRYDNLEHRCFMNPWLEERFALLVENTLVDKTFYILNGYGYRIESDLELFNFLAMERTMSFMGRWILHSSFIQTELGAILFSAPSGTGKSTQAELWHKYRGSEVINGDRSAIWKADDNIWYAGGVPWCGTSEITNKINLPLAGIVLLSQASENMIDDNSIIVCIKKLIREISINPWNRKMIAKIQLTLADLCGEIPVISLSCRPDEEAVQVLAKELGL